jgi:hypothetical protein
VKRAVAITSERAAGIKPRPESIFMTDTEIAWLAGLFDGEGCVWSRWPKRANLCVEIKMTDERTVARVHQFFPGLFVQGKLSRLAFGRKPQWRWSLDTDKAIEFLRLVRPHLFTKRHAADLALELVSRNGKQRLDASERTRRDGLVAALRATY